MHGYPGLVGWFAGICFLLPLNHDFLSGDLQSEVRFGSTLAKTSRYFEIPRDTVCSSFRRCSTTSAYVKPVIELTCPSAPPRPLPHTRMQNLAYKLPWENVLQNRRGSLRVEVWASVSAMSSARGGL